jgi:hypothetical protein
MSYKQILSFLLIIIPNLLYSQLNLIDFQKAAEDSKKDKIILGNYLHHLPAYTIFEGFKRVTVHTGYVVGDGFRKRLCNSQIMLFNFEFKKYLGFSSINFQEGVQIENSTFKNSLYIDDCKFKLLEMSGNDFSYVTCAWDTFLNFKIEYNKFLERIIFKKCKFLNSFKFSDNICEANILFKECKFDLLKLDMQSNNVKQVIFQDCKLPLKIKLKDVQSGDTRMSFINCYTDSGKYILLDAIGSDLSKIDMDYQNFKLDFTDSLIKPKSEVCSKVYLDLLENFQKNGKMNSYEILDLEYKKKFDVNWRYYIQKKWWNYGYNKEWVITRWSWRLLLIFLIVPFFFFKGLQEKVYEIHCWQVFARPAL